MCKKFYFFLFIYLFFILKIIKKFSCERLGMKSLAYLWNREQKELLSDMINNQMNSVLIKVCAMGLDKIDLMKSISEMKEKLFKLEQNNYLNVCGEGGEFESLTLDCPLYKKRINM